MSATLFLCGDVMLGRGIDQALPHPCPPQIHESYMQSALGYLRLAERANGAIRIPLDFAYVWGAALEEFDRVQPAARIINLETSITLSESYEPKGINYRMSPANARCLTAASIDCCVLANNHVLDWGAAGLLDTLDVLKELGIATAGAGRDFAEARAPAVLETLAGARILVFSFASGTSGTPRHWAARDGRPGINLLPDFSKDTVHAIARQIEEVRRPLDIVIASIHWGPNWGYEIGERERRFAHELIDEAWVSVIHGHSSHHAKAIEVYKERLILYGCGDFLNDYEGIAGYEEFRGDLALMYFASIDPHSGYLSALELVPLQIRRFQLVHPSREDTGWLQKTLDRESSRFGAHIRMGAHGLAAEWVRAKAAADAERKRESEK
jgi:poly-gamma-glutamate synthesis protein (capsule biosynthesis protein)